MDRCLRCIAALNPDPLHCKIWVLPYHGNTLYLNDGSAWVPATVPPNLTEINVLNCTIDGVANRAVIPDTNYRIYARLNSGNMEFELSQVAQQQDPSGFLVKTNHNTHRLIGGCHYVSGGIGLGLNERNYHVGSYFNRLSVPLAVRITGGASASGLWALLTTPTTRASAWTWGDGQEPLVHVSGGIVNSQPGNPTYYGIVVNGVLPPVSVGVFVPSYAHQTATVSAMHAHNANSEGFHSYDLAIKTEFSTGNAYVNPDVRLIVDFTG